MHYSTTSYPVDTEKKTMRLYIYIFEVGYMQMILQILKAHL